MNSSRIVRRARQWSTGAGLAAGAAAMMGLAGAPTAHADDLSTDIGLLDTAQTDVTDAFNALGQPANFPDLIGQFEAIQTPLLSSDNSFVAGLADSLFNGPDQQLAQASDAFLSAAEALAAGPTGTDELDAVSTALQFDGSLLFDSLPANVIGKLTDYVLGYDIASPGVATDLATSASSASATPDDVIGQAISDLNQSTTLLDTAATADLGTRSADLLSNSKELPAQLDTGLTQIDSFQDQLSASDQALLVDVDEQLVTAAQNLLPADQGFISADQAGELSTNSLTSADWTLLGADLDVLGAALYADGATLFAAFTGGLDLSSAADLASSLDPSIVADVLSSIGL